MHNHIIGPFIFAESTITADIYLDMLKHYVVLQLEEFQPWVVFQQDDTTPHWGLMVRDVLNETFLILEEEAQHYGRQDLQISLP